VGLLMVPQRFLTLLLSLLITVQLKARERARHLCQ